VLNGNANIFLDQNYVAGTEMSATWQMDNRTLAEMELVNNGSYVYNFSGGESVTLNIGGAPIPEPTTSVLGLFGAALLLRRRRTA